MRSRWTWLRVQASELHGLWLIKTGRCPFCPGHKWPHTLKDLEGQA